MNNCPLCNKKLRVGNTDRIGVYCSTEVICRGQLAYHYKLLPIEYVYIYPYRLMDGGVDESGNGVYQLHTLKAGDPNGAVWHYICDLPKFPLLSEEQILKKIKIAVVFS